MADSPQNRSPMAVGLEWVARITAVALLMFLPGVFGQWLDKRLGTQFLTLIGFAVGLIAGVGCLLIMTKAIGTKQSKSDSKTSDG